MIEKSIALENRVQIELSGDDLMFELDPDQIEQAMINLIRNAAEAVQSKPETADNTKLQCHIHWQQHAKTLVIDVIDSGTGLPESDNLFVPFFTTKPGGSGIGLLLVRRIAELHGGGFELLSREDGEAGAQARLWINAED
ncbi:MAG: ATP-binding protein [Pseudomonadota bacterium]